MRAEPPRKKSAEILPNRRKIKRHVKRKTVGQINANICYNNSCQASSGASKISKLIDETKKNPTGEKIVLLCMEVAQRPDCCFDFDIYQWLENFEQFNDDLNFTQVALIISSAAQIYARKVDFLHHMVSSSAAVTNSETNNGKETKKLDGKKGKSYSRSTTLHDRLYEAEMVAKDLKRVPLENTTEILSELHSFDAPNYYFRKWNEYKQWRKVHRKKMKSPLPYSVVCDETYIHSSMWKSSRIEDLDYDDDTETKRNFQSFTHYIEHRYSTLVPDINFLMHFKVKDFIESEEDEIEKLKLLKLPTPPLRTWPPLCRTTYSKKYAKENYDVDLDENNDDYIEKYIAVEDIVLQQDGNCETHLSTANTTAEIHTSTQNEITILETSNVHETINLCSTQIEVSTNPTNGDEDMFASVDDHLDTTENIADSQTENLSLAVSQNTDKTSDITPMTISMDQLRIDIDEGIFTFGGLDEQDRRMLNPYVELVDILKPWHGSPQQFSESFSRAATVQLDKKNTGENTTERMFPVERAYVDITQEFTLPLDYLGRKFRTEMNKLKLPENLLRKKVIFSLPDEFKLLKEKKFKRKSNQLPDRRNIHLKYFKLTDTDFTTLPATPSPSPNNFLGFSDSEVDYGHFDSENVLSSTMINTTSNSNEENLTSTIQTINKSRLISSDSGIFDSLNDNEETMPISGTITNTQDSGCVLETENLTTEGVEIDRLTKKMYDSTIESNDNNQIAERVKNWHEQLKPILAMSQSRSHFDVHNLGTEIIDKFPNDDSQPQTINFKAVMENIDPSRCSHIFLTVLHLVNSKNIAIAVNNPDIDQPLELENINLTLLSRERHTVSIDDNIGACGSSRKRGRSPAISDNETNSSKNTSTNTSYNKQPNCSNLDKRNSQGVRKILNVQTLRTDKEMSEDPPNNQLETSENQDIHEISQDYEINERGSFLSIKNRISPSTKHGPNDYIQNISRNFENHCPIYSHNSQIKDIQKAKNQNINLDDLDSGIFSGASTSNSVIS